MLKRSNRFHGRNSLNWVYRNGKTLRDPSLNITYALNQRRNNFRAAVVVSRKVNKSAVVRNRIRRKIYESIRQNSQAIRKNYDIIFTVYNSSFSEMAQEDLDKIINQLLLKANIF